MANPLDNLFGAPRDPFDPLDNLFGTPRKSLLEQPDPRTRKPVGGLLGNLIDTGDAPDAGEIADRPRERMRAVEAPSRVDLLVEEDRTARRAKAKEAKPGEYQSIGKAFLAGIDDLQKLSYSAVEAGGEALGADMLDEWGEQGRLRNTAEAEEQGARGKFSDIRTVGDAFAWAGQTAGNLIPVMVPGIVGAAAGAAAAPAAAVTATVGGAIGAFVPSLVMGVGEVQDLAKAKDETKDANGWTFLGGSAIAALDSVLPGKIGSKLVSVFGRDAAEEVAMRTLIRPATETLKAGGKGALIEGATEALQESIGEVAASKAAEQGVDWASLPERMLEAGAAGALMGAGVGAPTGYAEARQRKRQEGLDLGMSPEVAEAFADRVAPAEPEQAPLKPGDEESPIPTDIIQRGRNIQQRAEKRVRTPESPQDGGRDAFLARVRGAESGGDDSAKNPKSSASGRYQFTQGTWEGLGGDWSRRFDPGEQERLMKKLTDQNEAALKGAGVDLTAGNYYLAHFAGSGGAVALHRNPNAPVEQVLGADVVKANPFLAGMKGRDVIAWAAQKMGGAAGAIGADGSGFNRDMPEVAEAESSIASLKRQLGEDVLDFKPGQRVEVTQGDQTIPGTVRETYGEGDALGVRIDRDDGTTFDETLADAKAFGARITAPRAPDAPQSESDPSDSPRPAEVFDVPGLSGRNRARVIVREPQPGQFTADFDFEIGGFSGGTAGFAEGASREEALANLYRNEAVRRNLDPDRFGSSANDQHKKAGRKMLDWLDQQRGAAEPGPLESQGAPAPAGDFNPRDHASALRKIVRETNTNLNNINAVAKALDLTPDQANQVMGVLAASPDAGFRMTKGRPAKYRTQQLGGGRTRRVKVRDAVPPRYQREQRRTRPMTALEFVRSIGGVKSGRHDLRNVGALSRYPGVINNKAGRDLDEIGRALHEAGYFVGRDQTNPDDRPTEAETIEFLEQASGKRAYTAEDREDGEAGRDDDENRYRMESAVTEIVEERGFEFNDDELEDAMRYLDNGLSAAEAVEAAMDDAAARALEALADVTGNDFYDSIRDAIYEGENAEERGGGLEEGDAGPEGDEGDQGGRRPADAQSEEAAREAVTPPTVADAIGDLPAVESTAPEHRTVGVDDRELAEIVEEFGNVADSMGYGSEKISHIFDPPGAGRFRLADKVKAYHKDHGWMTVAEARAKIDEWEANTLKQGRDPAMRNANADKIVLSFFDLSGTWSEPWEQAGYQVWRFDIQADPDMGDVNNFSAEFFGDWFGDFEGKDVYAILAACPCTDFASSGARHFAAKDADGRTVASVKLVHQTLAAIEYFKPAIWALENPVGRIEKLGGLPPWRLSFDPNHLGDPYTKKTLIWGRFNSNLPIAPVEPTEGSKMFRLYGGKSLKTKNARSVTPPGFAYAFFQANNAIDHPAMAISNKFDRLDQGLIERAVKAGVTEEQITEAVEDFYYMDLDDDAANAAIEALIPGPDTPAAEAPGSARVEITPSGKGVAVIGASEAEKQAIADALGDKARGVPRKDGALVFSAKHVDKIRAALGAKPGQVPPGPARDAIFEERHRRAVASQAREDAKNGIGTAKLTAAEKAAQVRLRDWRGVEVPDYSEQGQRGDYDGGPTKDAFLKDGRDYAKAISTILAERGFTPGLDRKGRPVKNGGVRVNEGGVAVAGDVYLEMVRPDGSGFLMQFGQSFNRGGGASIRAVSQFNGGQDGTNRWLDATMSAADMADMLEGVANERARAPAAPAEPSPADVLAERPGDQRTALERQTEGRMRSTREQKAPGSDGGLFDTPDTTGDLFAAPAAPAPDFAGTVEENLSPDQVKAVADIFERAEQPGYGSTNKIFTKDKAEQARAIIRAQLRTLNSGFNPELAMAGMQLAGYHIEAGARKFAQLARTLADDLGVSMADLKPYLAAWYNGARDMLEGQGEDISDMDGAGAVRAAVGMIDSAPLPAPVLRVYHGGPGVDGDIRAPFYVSENPDFAQSYASDRGRGSGRVQAFDMRATKVAEIADIQAAARRAGATARELDETGGGFLLDPNFSATAEATVADLQRQGFDAARFYDFAVDDERNEQLTYAVLNPSIISSVTAPVDGIGDSEGTDNGATPNLDGGAAGQRPAGVQPLEPVADDGALDTGEGQGRERALRAPDEGRGADAGRSGDRPASAPERGGSGDRADGGRSNQRRAAASGVGNYIIEPGALNEARGPMAKARDNLAAIEIIRTLEREERGATADEQAALARYVGWGGLKNAFPDTAGAYGKGFETIGPRLRELLTPEQWDTARRSIQYAHYTAERVVREMWRAAQRLGFAGGQVFEPGMGTGNFAGMIPAAIRDHTHYSGIEMDGITAAIAKALYPQSGIREADYTQFSPGKNAFPLVIGNPPFADTVIKSDPEYRNLGFVLHDYFFAKSLDAVKPGGALLFVTSAGTMNKLDSSAREWLAERAWLAGAIRLPGDAFAENAGTQVTTDIVVLRKKLPGEDRPGWAAPDNWTETVDVTLPNREGQQTTGRVSRYFVDNPDMVLGEAGFFDKLYAGRYAVRSTGDLAPKLAAAVDRLPWLVMKDNADPATPERDFASTERKNGSFYISDGKLLQHGPGGGVPATLKSAKDEAIIRALLPVRDALRDVYAADLAENAAEAKLARARLNKSYDAFVAKHGPINKGVFIRRRPSRIQLESARRRAREEARAQGHEWEDGTFDAAAMFDRGATVAEVARARDEAREAAGKDFDEGTFDPETVPDTITEKRPNLNPFLDDPESYRLAAIEHYDDITGKSAKGPVFTESVVRKQPEPEINGPEDALRYVLNLKGRVDLDEIARLADVSPDDAATALTNLIYRDPESGEWQSATKYLSGNVRAKLAKAEAAAANDSSLRVNVDALRAVIPPDRGPSEVRATLGMTWIDPKDIEDFAKSHLGLSSATIQYRPRLAEWSASGDTFSAASTSTWGTARRNAIALIGDALNQATVKITDPVDGDPNKRVLNEQETQAANDKLTAIREEFGKWIWADEARTERLLRVYNDLFNSHVAPQHDGSHMTTPGVSAHWKWRPHQLRGISRIVEDGNTYLAHAVGAGKTSTAIASIMEMKRLGLVNKPMIVVPNHMLVQFTKEFYELYPLANIMVADEDRSFVTHRRKQFVADMASNDIDAVIIKHSAFNLIPLSEEFQRRLLRDHLEELRSMLAEMKAANEDRITRSKVENLIQKAEERMRAVTTRRTDQTFTFEETGVDHITVDEAHLFRKLDYASRRSNIKGIDPQGSQRAMDLYMKAQYLEQRRPGRSLTLMSGTPITNTMAELFSIQRYLQPQELRARGIAHFDAWANSFGDVVTDLEPTAGGQYKSQTRFARFVNVPELSVMVRQVMDVVTSEQLGEYVVRPKVTRELVNVPVTPSQEAYVDTLAARERAIAERGGRAEKGDDILLTVIGDGRKSAIDMRLVDPSHPPEDNKLERLIDNAHRVWKESAKQPFHDITPEGYSVKPTSYGPAAQMIFSSLGVGANSPFNVHRYIADSLVKRGVPRDQIVLFNYVKNDVAKQKVFNDTNSGKVRFLIGSVEKMGTGVNAQQRLIANHNLDPEWLPSSDEQRNGRINRQGNMNPAVTIYDYATKGTYDSQMWGMMGRKAKFIEGFFRGDPNMRDMEDLGEASTYEQIKALTTKDPRILELTENRQELEKEKRRRDAHESQRYTNARRAVAARAWVDSLTSTLALEQADAAQATDIRGDAFTAELGGTTYTKRPEFQEALKGMLEAATKEGTTRIGEIGGFPLALVSEIHKTLSGEKVVSRLEHRVVMMLNRDPSSTEARYLKLALGDTVASASATLDRIRQRPRDTQNEIKRMQAEADQFGALAANVTPYEGEARIAELEAAVKTIEDQLAAEAAAAAATNPAAPIDPEPLAQPLEGGDSAFQRWFGDSKVVDANGAPRVMYHATTADFNQFELTEDIGFHFGTGEQANSRLDQTRSSPKRLPDEGENIITAYLKIENPLRLPDLNDWAPDAVVAALEEAGVITDRESDFAIGGWQVIDREWVRDKLAAKGYDGIVYRNTNEGAYRRHSFEELENLTVTPNEWVGRGAGPDKAFIARADNVLGQEYGRTEEEARQKLLAVTRREKRMIADSYIVFDSTQIKSTANAGTFDPNNPNIMAEAGAPVEAEATREEIDRVAERAAIELERLGIDDKVLGEVHQRLQTSRGKAAGGLYWPGQRLIQLSMNSGNKTWTIGHEALHAMRDLGLFTRTEWNLLKGRAWDRRSDEFRQEIRNRWGEGLTEEQYIEEAIAEEVGEMFYILNDPKTPRWARPIIRRIAKLLAAIGRAIAVVRPSLRERSAAHQVLLDIVEGRVGRRPIGFGGQGVTVTWRGPVQFGTKRSEPLASVGGTIDPAGPEFDEESEARWREAKKGVGNGPGVLENTRAWWQDLTAGFTRHWRALPNEPRFADVQQQLRKLEAAPDAALEDSVAYLRSIVADMDAAEYDLFARKVVLDDLSWDAGEDRALPFGFTPATLQEARARVDAQFALNPKLVEALRKRKAHNRTITDEMVRTGVLTRDQVKNPAYFRHMVLDYARHEQALARAPGKVKSPYWAKRMGSTLDINANLLEAEMDWLQKAKIDTVTAETIDWIKESPLNIREELRDQAKRSNKVALEVEIARNPEAAEQDKEFRSLIARGIKIVQENLQQGYLHSIPEHLRGAAEALEAGDRTGDPPFALFAWILDGNRPGSMGAGMVLKASGQRKAWARQLLGNKYVDPDDMAGLLKRFPREGYAAWQPIEGRHMFTAKTISESALDMFVTKLADTASPGLDRAELAAALGSVRSQLVQGGERYTMIIPEELAATLDEFGDRRGEGMVARVFGGVQSAWKRWILINPRRFLKYNLNNMTGDLDAIIAGNPGVLRRVGEAWRLLKAGDGPRYREALERGVFTAGLSAQEIPDINAFSEFRHLTEAPSKRPDKLLATGIAKVWRTLQDATNFRESLFRLAAYLDYADRIEAGESQQSIGYGASVPNMVDAVSDPKDRAALLARDLIGDYGGISTAGQWLRRYLIPFWSWTEINTRRYWRLTNNAFGQSTAKGLATGGLLGAGIAARAGVWAFTRMAMVYGVLYLWNHLLFPDEEDELGEMQKAQLHLILGRDSANQVVSIRTQGALSDVFALLGFADAVRGLKKHADGQMSLGQVAQNVAKAPVNRVLTSTTPLISVPIEQAMGKELWPDMFDPREIHDRWRHIFSTVSLENEYDQVADRPTRGYMRSWTESVVYRRDPDEMAYDEAKGLAYDWLERVKGQEGGGMSSPRSAALRDYRMALKFGDAESADEALLRYEELGGTEKGLNTSIAKQHPLGPISKKDRDAYLDSLTEDQLDTVARAEEYWKRIYEQ